MFERQPLRYQDARKVAGQLAGWRDLSGMRMTRKGAFFFFSYHYGALTVVDEMVMTEDERTRLTPFVGEPVGLCKIEAGLVLNADDEIQRFLSPLDLERGAGRDCPRRIERITLWQFEWDAWCLAHIFAGITTKGHGDREALKIYDRDYASSSHDRMQARAAIQQRLAA